MFRAGKAEFSFDRETILASAPDRSGIYPLFNASGDAYLGKTGSIRKTLLAQLSGDFATTGLSKPTTFVFELVGEEERRSRFDEVIRHFDSINPPIRNGS